MAVKNNLFMVGVVPLLILVGWASYALGSSTSNMQVKDCNCKRDSLEQVIYNHERSEILTYFNNIQDMDSILLEDIVTTIHEFESDPKPLSRENMAQALMDMEILYPNMAYNSSIAESITSGLAKNGNNVFGMKKPLRRRNCALPDRHLGHASYRSWIYSIADYKLFQSCKKERQIGTRQKWIKYLNGNYAVSRKYGTVMNKRKLPDKIKTIIKK